MTERPSRALYSVLFGGYERLNEQPAMPATDMPRLLLTDDRSLRSDFWHVVVVDPLLPGDSVRSQRMLKILGHSALERFDETLYVDNSVELRVDPNDLLDDWLSSHEVALPSHSYHDTILKEFEAVVELQYDDPTRVFEQLHEYRRSTPDVLGARPYWTAILARRDTQDVREAMRRWAAQVLRYSRRDQLSAVRALSDLAIREVELDNRVSQIHRWPIDLGRRIELGKTFVDPSRPHLTDLIAVEDAKDRMAAELESLQRALDESRRERDALIGERARLERAAATARDEDNALHAESARRESELRDEIHRLRDTVSWRVTAPLRAVRGALRRR